MTIRTLITFLTTVILSSGAETTLRLSELAPQSDSQGWGSLAFDGSVGGKPLRITGKEFSCGLGAHAPSEIVYNLDGQFQTLNAWVGIDDEVAQLKQGSVVFQVFGDGQKLFDSGVMRSGDPAKRVAVSLTGITTLKLIAGDAGDGNKCDHADWGDAFLVGGKSEDAYQKMEAKYEVSAPGITARIDSQGKLVNFLAGGRKLEWPLTGRTRMAGCHLAGDIAVSKTGGSYSFTRKLANASGHACTVTDRFSPTPDSIRWEIEISGNGTPWSTDILTELEYPTTTETRFWTAWSDPEHQTEGWRDPRVLMPFSNTRWSYSNLQFMSPTKGDFFAIPLLTVAEPATDTGISLIISPEDTLLDLWLQTRGNGSMRLTRQKHRLGGGNIVKFSMDIVAHEAGWSGGLRWMTERYPQFFNPPNRHADVMAGCGAYSGCEDQVDVVSLRKMSFRTNWKLSDDFPYMGMFIPPVKDADESWTRSCGEPAPPGKKSQTSCRQMNDYARYMKDSGFFVLNYFNVTEFGKNMGGSAAAGPGKPGEWQDPQTFLSSTFPNAVIPGSTFYGARVMDCGDPPYQEFLLEQTRRHIRLLPDTAGICIDRMDWLRNYNTNADDGVSWINHKSARALTVSWKELQAKLGPEMHAAGKVVFCNPMDMRLDLMREIDGFYTEHGESGPGLNSFALLALRKPAITWTCMWWDKPVYDLKPDPDSFFQRHLLMGVYPTAPYPFNNHALQPSTASDPHYLDYGPLMEAMRGKKWVLAPHCVETSTPGVKVNLFQVPGGYALPVTFGGTMDSASVVVRNLKGMDQLKCTAIHPGKNLPTQVPTRIHDGALELQVPLKRGCAMLLLSDHLDRH